jgi:3'(2'), 5'-bisphosphate nucleotidase
MPPLQKELTTAIAAVSRATRLTQKIFTSIQSGQTNSAGTVTKPDKSPVTVADYGSQAIVNALLKWTFPKDPIVGEEDADELRKNPELREKVWNLVYSTLQEMPSEEKDKGGAIDTDDEMLSCLDPIDGTQGFLRGGQYAVCLALIIDGTVRIGVLACPNLPFAFNDPLSARGILVYGIKGNKAYRTTLNDQTIDSAVECQMKRVDDISQATFCESVEPGHSTHVLNAQISRLLGIKSKSVRMDSQAKYASLATGNSDIYLRLPTSKTYEEKIWVNSIFVRHVESLGSCSRFSAGRTGRWEGDRYSWK